MPSTDRTDVSMKCFLIDMMRLESQQGKRTRRPGAAIGAGHTVLGCHGAREVRRNSRASLAIDSDPPVPQGNPPARGPGPSPRRRSAPPHSGLRPSVRLRCAAALRLAAGSGPFGTAAASHTLTRLDLAPPRGGYPATSRGSTLAQLAALGRRLRCAEFSSARAAHFGPRLAHDARPGTRRSALRFPPHGRRRSQGAGLSRSLQS